ncbi:g5068 [Coccomyxa elongata]
MSRAADQIEAAGGSDVEINTISQVQRDAYVTAAAAGASNETILAAVKSLQEKASISANSPKIAAPTRGPSSHPASVATLPAAYGPAYGPGNGPPLFASPPAYSPGYSDLPSYAPGACTALLDLNQLSQCCPASSCLMVDGTCGTVTPCNGAIGGMCTPAVGNITCSDMLGNHQAVINGRCNGEGVCIATDQAQIGDFTQIVRPAAWLCGPGSVKQQQCTEFPDRFLTCTADVSLTAQRKSGEDHILVAMGTSLGSCTADSDCSIGEMCSGKALPGMCQPIAAGGQC